ncbi:hypothetical protein D3C84_1235250 [compost metagenome]
MTGQTWFDRDNLSHLSGTLARENLPALAQFVWRAGDLEQRTSGKFLQATVPR